jgi:hypothetical protein
MRWLWIALVVLIWGCAMSAASSPASEVRPSVLAGSWYPEARVAVQAEVHRMLRASREAPRLSGPPLALVVPHAGWRFSGLAAAAAYRQLEPGIFSRVVVVGTAHHETFSGFSVPSHSVSAYRTPLGDVPLCAERLATLRDGQLVRTRAGAHAREHSIEIQLPFLQETLESFCLVPILAGRTDAGQQRELAERLAAQDDGKTVYVFSSDFTHYGPRYGFTPFGPSAPAARTRIDGLDERAVELLERIDGDGFRAWLERTHATVCGRHALGVLTELLPRLAGPVSATRLAHYTSLDVPGFTDDSSVTYVALAFSRSSTPAGGTPLKAPPQAPTCAPEEAAIDDELGRLLAREARAAIRTHLTGAPDLHAVLRALPEDRSELDRLQGVFVTLHRTDPEEIARHGRLRGCIGQIFPKYPLHEAVVVAAVGAAVNDRRFPPVQPEELKRLELEVTVLAPPRPIEHWREIELGKHGIVLERGRHEAVFLPQVAPEQGWTLEQTLAHLARKAGLDGDAWRSGCRFEVFTGQVFREHDPTPESDHER